MTKTETIKKSKVGALNFHSKTFTNRESLITDLLKVEHIQPIYNVFCIGFIMMYLQNICQDYLQYGSIYFGLKTLQKAFQGFGYAFASWCVINLLAILTFYGYKLWYELQQKSQKKPAVKFFINVWALLLYIGMQAFVLYLAATCCLDHNLPFATTLSLLMESTRILMKMHAFIRTNIGNLSNDNKLKSMDDEKVKIKCQPNIKHYIYFLFAPTLIYRDHYPRVAAKVRWNFVAARLLEIVAITFFYIFLYENYLHPNFEKFWSTKTNLFLALRLILNMMLPSFGIFISMFYLILHSTQNCMAEILRFGDRMFYKCWWSISSYDGYFRTWNCVVQDWLYEYIYKDFCRILGGSRFGASLVVMTISAVVHEFILSITLHMFFPLLYGLFGILGVFFIQATRKFPQRFGNLFFWFTLLLGMSAIISLYGIEYYAKKMCPKTVESFMDYLVPNFWVCLKNSK